MRRVTAFYSKVVYPLSRSAASCLATCSRCLWHQLSSAAPPWLAAACPRARLKGTALETGPEGSVSPVSSLLLALLCFGLSAVWLPASGHASGLTLAGCRENGLSAPLPARDSPLLPPPSTVAAAAAGVAAGPRAVSTTVWLAPSPAAVLAFRTERYAGWAVPTVAAAVRADGLSTCSANRTSSHVPNTW